MTSFKNKSTVGFQLTESSTIQIGPKHNSKIKPSHFQSNRFCGKAIQKYE
jgi:hypothetical protein